MNVPPDRQLDRPFAIHHPSHIHPILQSHFTSTPIIQVFAGALRANSVTSLEDHRVRTHGRTRCYSDRISGYAFSYSFVVSSHYPTSVPFLIITHYAYHLHTAYVSTIFTHPHHLADPRTETDFPRYHPSSQAHKPCFHDQSDGNPSEDRSHSFVPGTSYGFVPFSSFTLGSPGKTFFGLNLNKNFWDGTCAGMKDCRVFVGCGFGRGCRRRRMPKGSGVEILHRERLGCRGRLV